jgi:hypothetical protein
MRISMFTLLLLLPAAAFVLMTRLPFDFMGWVLLVPVVISLGSLALGFLNLRRRAGPLWTYFVVGLSQLPWLAIMYWFLYLEAEKSALAPFHISHLPTFAAPSV